VDALDIIDGRRQFMTDRRDALLDGWHEMTPQLVQPHSVPAAASTSDVLSIY
jgi:hypothetical protein